MLPILLIVVLLIIAYQDLRHRSVHVILFPTAAALGFWLAGSLLSISEIITYAGLNLLFVMMNITLLYCYLVIRYKISIRQAFSSYIGVGDLLFWIALIPLFSTIHYIYLHFF